MKFRVLAVLAALVMAFTMVGFSPSSATTASSCTYWNGCKPFSGWRHHRHHVCTYWNGCKPFPYWRHHQRPGLRLTAASTDPCLFNAGSYWCTPLDASGAAPVDPSSGAWVKDSQANAPKGYLTLTNSTKWSQPMYDSTCSDPLYHIVPTANGPTLDLHIPSGAKPAAGKDSQLTVDDHCNGIDTDLHHASFSSGHWKAEQTSRFYINSGGLAEDVAGGTAGNTGHRGIPAWVRGFKLSDVQYAVSHGLPDVGHRLEVSWYDTGAGQNAPIWPMDGWEKRHNGGVPEGTVVRIKPGVVAPAGLSAAGKVIFRTLQTYGGVVADTGNNTVKLQNYVNWSSVGVSRSTLSGVPWSEYEFVRRGYDPRTGTTH